ncbi:Phosphoribosylformimino-5-aminoimidazole carboxamide ribotide isomerase isoform D [Glycine soja]|uniref:1-(5-phosphoribosyl)-5-[(5-phosphoribosylamino)methylideneamino] imidazole-4-carboxamide isomerase HISN3, chloroplastic n=1 Tax=Glycine soja TaxID=3848 RepID=A0A445LJX3_GLYSO|nr:Phosphoribosylformimino-5-aminoimidazole carboxamide ribotide isomerase isoform D [Glycine soja]
MLRSSHFDLAFLSPSATKLEQRSGGGRSRRRQWLTKRCGGVLCCSRLRSSSRMRNLAAPHSLGVFIFRPNKPPFLTLPSLSRRSLPSIQCGAVQFRPCIDIHKGKVKQIVGSTLQDLKGSDPVTNFESDKSAAEYATLYKQDGLTGGHVIMLGADPLSKAAALQALHAYPGGLQVGGGINSDNCLSYIEEGASHVIVTSYVFNNGQMDIGRLKDLVQIVGKERLVLDLSCRKKDGKYAIVTDRWQKFSDVFVDPDVMEFLANFADEFLVHGVDVEGKKLGIDEELVALLGKYSTIPVTYAGGVTEMADLERIRTAGMESVNVTMGSALDIFGGNLAYEDVVAWHAQQNAFGFKHGREVRVQQRRGAKELYERSFRFRFENIVLSLSNGTKCTDLFTTHFSSLQHPVAEKSQSLIPSPKKPLNPSTVVRHPSRSTSPPSSPASRSRGRPCSHCNSQPPSPSFFRSGSPSPSRNDVVFYSFFFTHMNEGMMVVFVHRLHLVVVC